MEHIEGVALQHYPFSPKTPYTKYLQYLTETLEGLNYAHSKDIVHRDIKPSNIMVGRDGRTRLLDFGLARSKHENHELTAMGTILGTVGYMPPEVAKGDEATPVSDIYSLGIVFYELLSGKLPFVSDTPLKTLELIKSPTPLDFSSLSLRIPSPFFSILKKMVSKDVDLRYQKTSDILRDIRKMDKNKETSTSSLPKIEQQDLSEVIQLAGKLQSQEDQSLGQSTLIQIGEELEIEREVMEKALQQYKEEQQNSDPPPKNSTHKAFRFILGTEAVAKRLGPDSQLKYK